MSQITTVLQIDVRNPNDRLVFDLFGMLEPFGPIINYVKPMVSSDVLFWFEKFATRSAMAMVISTREPSDAAALYRIYSLWKTAQGVDIVNLIVQNRTFVGTADIETIIKPTLKLTQQDHGRYSRDRRIG